MTDNPRYSPIRPDRLLRADRDFLKRARLYYRVFWPQLSNPARLVYDRIDGMAYDKGARQYFRSFKALSKETRLSRDSLADAIVELLNLDLVAAATALDAGGNEEIKFQMLSFPSPPEHGLPLDLRGHVDD